jgi:hypothetical protein
VNRELEDTMADRTSRHLRRAGTWVVALVLVLVGGSYALATGAPSAGSGQRIYACVTSSSGALNLSNATRRCRAGQHKISWAAGGRSGPAGPSGARGARGAKGDTGLAGATGAKGDAGAIGARGDTGATGTPGTPGTPGAPGTNGADAPAQYAYIFNVAAEVVTIEADLSFDSNGIVTSGFTHTPGTTAITVGATGRYEVHFAISAVEPNQFTLFVNGAAVPGATYGSGAGTQQNSGQVVVALSAGDVLTVRNHSSASAVTLQTLAGGTQTNVNASVLIQRLPT